MEMPQTIIYKVVFTESLYTIYNNQWILNICLTKKPYLPERYSSLGFNIILIIMIIIFSKHPFGREKDPKYSGRRDSQTCHNFLLNQRHCRSLKSDPWAPLVVRLLLCESLSFSSYNGPIWSFYPRCSVTKERLWRVQTFAKYF